jgi:hypothetical protein
MELLTPKAKARELYVKFNPHVRETNFWSDNVLHEETIVCARILVEELIKETRSKYWYDVKRELEEL